MVAAKRAWAVGAAPLVLFGAAVALVAACSAPGGEPVGTSRAASTPFANDQPAYDYFVSKGLTSFQAAGIVGNLDQESGVDPAAVQSGGPGRGIAQWSLGGRWDTSQGDNLVAYAAAQGQSTTSLTLQLEFIWYELQTLSAYGLVRLRATTNVTDATVAFETDFEGCGACSEAARVAYAKDVLAAYGGSPVQVDGGGAHDGAGASDAIARDAVGETADSWSLGDAGSTSPEVTGVASGCAVERGGAGGSSGGGLLVTMGIVLAGARRRRGRGKDLVQGPQLQKEET